jgi:hypothetical protein
MFMFLFVTIFLTFPQICFSGNGNSPDGEIPETIYRVAKTVDFEITGDGSSENWERARWLKLVQLRPAKNDGILSTKAKALYSQTGIYFLFHCEDRMLTATMDANFMDLWKEDVVEVFLWPDEAVRAYFEYELSPLNYELAILVSNIDGELHRRQPFHHETDW